MWRGLSILSVQPLVRATRLKQGGACISQLRPCVGAGDTHDPALAVVRMDIACVTVRLCLSELIPSWHSDQIARRIVSQSSNIFRRGIAARLSEAELAKNHSCPRQDRIRVLDGLTTLVQNSFCLAVLDRAEHPVRTTGRDHHASKRPEIAIHGTFCGFAYTSRRSAVLDRLVSQQEASFLPRCSRVRNKRLPKMGIRLPSPLLRNCDSSVTAGGSDVGRCGVPKSHRRCAATDPAAILKIHRRTRTAR